MKPKDIKTIRHNLKLTQEQFAKKIGVSDRTIRRWENGEIKINKTAELLIIKFL